MSELFFSKATISFSGVGEQERGATRGYLVHQAVASLFGQYDSRPYLYRSDANSLDGSETILVLSSLVPRMEVGHGKGLMVSSLETTRYPDGFTEGTQLDFEILLNATKDLAQTHGKRSSRVDVWESVWRSDKSTPLDPHSVYADYLQRRLAGLARIDVARITERKEEKVRRSIVDRAPIVFIATNVIGTLTIVDPDGFRARLARGIGRSLSLGCGLMCLSRPGAVLPRRYGAAFLSPKI